MINTSTPAVGILLHEGADYGAEQVKFVSDLVDVVEALVVERDSLEQNKELLQKLLTSTREGHNRIVETYCKSAHEKVMSKGYRVKEEAKSIAASLGEDPNQIMCASLGTEGAYPLWMKYTEQAEAAIAAKKIGKVKQMNDVQKMNSEMFSLKNESLATFILTPLFVVSVATGYATLGVIFGFMLGITTVRLVTGIKYNSPLKTLKIQNKC